MANSALPRFVPLEDANDLIDFYEATKRTIPRGKWAMESIAAASRASNEACF